ANIETHEDNITRIKRELRQGRIIVENVEKISRQCEKIATFRFELDEVNKQQYQARQE
ncbi:3004_t:CDS:1, partial [Paraglomus occultum]